MQTVRMILASTAAMVGVLLLTPLVVLTVPIWCVTLLTKGFRRFVELKATPWQEVIEYSAGIGWKPKANLETQCGFAAGQFRVKTGNDGWAGQRTLEESDIVVFGDSHAFGFGVDVNRAFFEISRDLRIKAIGSPGYNMVQELLLMKACAPRLAGKLVVWFIYFGNDLYDNLLPNFYQYRMPFVRRNRSGSWEIMTRHIRPKAWPYHFQNNVHDEERFRGVFGTNVLSKRIYDACEFLIGEGRKLCGNAGADLVVMTLPWPIQLSRMQWEQRCAAYGRFEEYDRDAPDRRIAEICAKLDVPLVQGSRWLQSEHHIPNEDHWNESGHRHVARILEQLYGKWTGAGRSTIRSRARTWNATVVEARAPGHA